MEHPKDLDLRTTYPIRNKIARIEHYEFTGSRHPPGASQIRLGGKLRHRMQYALDNQTRSICIIRRNERGFLIEVA